MNLRSFEGQFEPEVLAWARTVHDRIFGSMPLIWSRKGTWIEAWNGARRIAFAPHQGGASIYFRSAEPARLYRESGGTCRTGRFTIHVPMGADYEPGLLALLVADALGLPSEARGDPR